MGEKEKKGMNEKDLVILFAKVVTIFLLIYLIGSFVYGLVNGLKVFHLIPSILISFVLYVILFRGDGYFFTKEIRAKK